MVQPIIIFDLIHALGRRPLRIAGLDLVEVAPPLDVNHITALAGIRAIIELCGPVWRSLRPTAGI